MPTAFSDPSTTLYVILGVLVVIFGSVAVRRQRRSDVINLAIPAALLLALFLIDQAVESPREVAVRKIKEMGTASREKKADDLFRHVSDSFKYRSLDKKGLRDRARQAEAMGFGGIAEYDVARSGFKTIDENTVEQGFRVKHTGQPEVHFYVVATFKKDPDGEWRLATFKLFDPVNVSDEKDIPGV
jgi:ketosteroid isomerase-like protein